MKKCFLTLFGIALCTIAFAQWGDEDLDEKPSFRDRVFTGGGFGLGFSSYRDNVSFSPMIGYRLTNRLATGLTFQYQYNKYKQIIPPLSTNDYGAGLFLRYNFYGPLFLHGEYEYLDYVYGVSQTGEKLRDGFSSLLAGAGYFQPLGRKAGFYLVALYNFSYVSPYSGQISPYSEPLIFRAGITMGF